MGKGKVTRVIDGDTFRIRGGKAIRLANVGAPELGTRGGAKARDVLDAKIGGKTVTYRPVGKSYGRTVAQVKIAGRSVNRSMRNRGYKSKGK